MELSRTFTLKEQLASIEGSTLPDKVLRSELSEDQKTVTAFESYFEDLTSGDPERIKSAKLRLTPKFANDFLVDEKGNYVRIGVNGPAIPKADVPLLEVEQSKLLITLSGEVSQAISEKETTQKTATAFSTYAADLASGDPERIKSAELRLTPKFANDFLVDEKGNYVRIGVNGPAIPKADVPLLEVEQREILVEIEKLITDPQVSAETRSLVGKYINTSNTADLARLQSMMTLGSSNISERVGGTISQYNTLKRRLDLRQSFYTTLFQDESVEKAVNTLAGFEQQSVEDTSLVANLRERAFGIRRLRLTSNFAATLAVPDRNFDQSLSLIGILEKSSNQEDRVCGRVLRSSLYGLELTTFRDEVRKMIRIDTDPRRLYSYIDSLPVRPTVGSDDYIQTLSSLKERVSNFYVVIGKISRLKQANSIRAGFAGLSVDRVISRINSLADETGEEIAVKLQLVELYKSYLAVNKPGLFDERFKREITEGIEAKLKQKFISPELGKNKAAFNYIRENFVRVIYPLIEVFRDDPRTKKDVDRLLSSSPDGQTSNPRLRFIQKLTQLEGQRPLTDIERAYIQSVELLTLFNPYLVAAATAEFGVTSEFLRHHFDILSQKTQDKLKDGDYVPLIQVGTGPNGLAAFGEIVRNNPELARQTLIVDSGEQPGGPFAIPRGPAWELNSANRRGLGGYTMPDAPNGNELKTVRAYGSPVARWYPGERSKGAVIRQGSINTTVDYLPTPDDLSTARYPTNEELQTILALQTAILTQNLALKTELEKVEPNPNQDEKGDKIATLKIVDRDGKERVVKVKTDGVFISSGLGEPTYGFKLEGSRAERVLQETAGMTGFPKITTTLEAFRALSDRTQEKKSPGKTLAIWGRGNSADTLIEFIGNIFQGDNPLVRDVAKIYIVSEGDLSSRPRYSLISDLKPRNGRGNLIELVKARVADIDFAGSSGPPEKREIVLLDTSGRPIVDSEGRPISANSGIAATGFSPQLERIFDSYLEGGRLRDEGQNAPLQPISLPTNPNVAVAESFRADPNIILLGTASRPRFNSFEKLAQLPPEAREALLRNGAENAVAIGFRAPDTQAAVNIWLNQRSISIEPQSQEPKLQISIEGEKVINSGIVINRSVQVEDLGIPNNIDQEDLLLSPLLAYNLGNKFDLAGNFSGNVDFGLEYNPQEGRFILRFKGGDIQSISSEVLEELARGVSDKYFQRFALSLLGKRRRDPKLDLNVSFKSGKINPKNTYVQAT